MGYQVFPRRRLGWSVLIALGLSLGIPTNSEASRALSSGQKIGALSAKLLKKPYSSLTDSQKYQVICDPVEPIFGSTSLRYDPYATLELGTAPRVSLEDVIPAPGYDVGGLVQVRVVVGETPFLVFQALANFLENPAGTETGYAQIFFTKTGTTGRMDALPDFQLIDSAGITEGPDSVDTHAFVFTQPGAAEFNVPVEFEHFATDGSMGNAADFFDAIDDQGNQFTVPAGSITPVVVQTPEPTAVALLGLAAGGTLLRRRRQKA